MPVVTYVDSVGVPSALQVPVGTSVMSAAVAHGLDGIVAECGGNAMCATCHVYIAESDLARIPPMKDVEDEMLDSTAAERTGRSRLSCQLVVTPELDGLTVHLPSEQE